MTCLYDQQVPEPATLPELVGFALDGHAHDSYQVDA